MTALRERTELLFTRRMLLAGAVALAAPGAAASGRTLRIAVLEFGTARWELAAIEALGLAKAEDVDLEVKGFASASAARLAFLAGEADAMVSDWLWIARERAAGRDLVLLPYSRAVGGIIVPPDSDVQAIPDLAGRTIGIAGGPLDKSWLILRAYAIRQGFDLEAETEQIFAAPPLLSAQAQAGKLDALVTYWHYMARLAADGFRTVIDVSTAAQALGLDPATPLLGYVFRGEFVAGNPDLVRGFAAASRAAKRKLQFDAPWEDLRPLMRAARQSEFAALRDGFRKGTPGKIEPDSAAAMFAMLRELGGPALTGSAERLPEGIFVDP